MTEREIAFGEVLLVRRKAYVCVRGSHDACGGWTEPLLREPMEPCECPCHEEEE